MKQNLHIDSCKSQLRDYICPCGKSYLSYPALFTHIKKKHNGNPPGQIKKPLKNNSNRLALRQKHQNMMSQKKEFFEYSSIHKNRQDINLDYTTNRIYKEEFMNIFELLEEITIMERVNSSVWQYIDSFLKLEQFINQSQEQNSIIHFCLGNIISEFLKNISLNTRDFRFEQVLLLFIGLLQYIMQQNHGKDILREFSIQILIQYINPFINQQLETFIRNTQCYNLWILQKDNINKVFMCFYNWLKWKDYTQFCITLIE